MTVPAMVLIGEMSVSMGYRLVAMPMRMGPAARMRVTMVFVVLMLMLVLDRLVRMRMLVTFCQMQPHPDSHEKCGQDRLCGD